MQADRRRFLIEAPAAAASVAATLAFHRLIARERLVAAAPRASRTANGYGPPQPAKSVNTGETLLALPAGFQYTVLGKTGAKMSDGRLTPRAHDGMAAFKVGNELRLVRNHEINNGRGAEGVTIGEAARSYDPLAGGGTSTLVIDPRTHTVIRDFISLSGTLQNCAGGPTPWGSWITCEETVLGQPLATDSQGRERGGFTHPHGYCFEVPASSNEMVAPVPLKAMGRFVHEAIAVDPSTGIVYLTEDQGAAGFYRFIPNRRGRLHEGGRLEMLAIKDRPAYDTRTGQQVNTQLAATWVEIKDPDPSDAQTVPAAVYRQGVAAGAATFARLEGCWHGSGRIYFTATSGGEKRLGQVWSYRPRGRDGGDLTLLFESSDPAILNGPDNLCVTPRGGLLICEDSVFKDGAARALCGLTPEGQIFDFAHNLVKGLEDREFAGATFSPDGKTLFFNIQNPGFTFAVWGPWKDGAL